MAFLAGEVRYKQILERRLGAFCVWKVSEEEFFTSRQRELYDKRNKDIKQHDVLKSIEHSEPVQNMGIVRAISQRVSCAIHRSLDYMWQEEPLSACD